MPLRLPSRVLVANVQAFADKLRHPDAVRLARSALLVRNAERRALLVAALRVEQCATPAPMRKPSANKVSKLRCPVTRHSACEALKRAARDFLHHPTRTHELLSALRTVADAHSLPLPAPRLRKRASEACPLAVHDAALDCGYSPSPANLLTAVSTLTRYGLAVLAQHDAQPVRLLNPKIKAPEPPAPQIHRAPAGALDWSTSPVIGVDPATLAEQSQRLERICARDEQSAKKGLLPTFRLIKITKRANSVSKSNRKLARMGREVLTLSR